MALEISNPLWEKRFYSIYLSVLQFRAGKRKDGSPLRKRTTHIPTPLNYNSIMWPTNTNTNGSCLKRVPCYQTQNQNLLNTSKSSFFRFCYGKKVSTSSYYFSYVSGLHLCANYFLRFQRPLEKRKREPFCAQCTHSRQIKQLKVNIVIHPVVE